MKFKQLIVASTILVMRITALPLLFLAVSAFSLYAKDGSAQDILEKRITLNVKNESLQRVIALIRQQTKVDFSFSASSIKAQKAITCSVKDKTLQDFFDEDLIVYNIGYRIVNDQVVLYQDNKTSPESTRDAPVLTNRAAQQAADIEVTGTVSDDKGQPIQGVTVRENGTTNATGTDSKGFFRLRVKSSASVLSFSSVGYTPQEITVGEQKTFSVLLATATNALEDVIIVGYGTQKKINSTGAVSTIGTKELVQSPVANISNSLVGRLPGLFATQAGGEPGNDASKIRIRGVGTFSGNTDPLVIVDGIQVDNYNNIDPNEIESVTILKDASSTAVYGIRGANGVIIITTKRGKTGPPRISYTFNQGFNSFTQLRHSMNAADYATNFNTGLKADAYVTGAAYIPRYSERDIELFRSGEDPIFHPDRDWADLLFRDISTQSQHNINISGGQRKLKYFISGGYFNQQGLFKDLTNVVSEFNTQSIFRRFNIRSNFNFEVTKRLNIALDISSQTEIRSGSNAAAGTERVVGDILRASPLDGPGIVDGKIVNINAQNGNPYLALLFPAAAGGVSRSYRNYLNGSLRADLDLSFITKGLSTHGTVAIQTFNQQVISNSKTVIFYMAYPINGGPIEGGTVNYVPNTTEAQFGFSQNGTYNRRITAEAAIDYKRRFGRHNVTGLALYNQQKTFDPTFQFGVPKAYQSYVGRIMYDYDGRYLAEFNGGYNGTENFAPGKRFGFFPAYSLGWVISKEAFFPQTKAITFLKVRASTGEVGNDQIGGNRFLYNPTTYSLIRGFNGALQNDMYYFGNVGTTLTGYPGFREGATGNPNVTWERSIKQNLGLELYLYDDKLKLNADLFSEKRDNILAVPQTISAITGLIQPSTNLGRMENKGYEGDISFSDFIGKVGYRIGANYSFARNKVLFRDEIPNTYAYQNRTGQRFGQNFALIADGIYNTWDEVNDAKRPVYQANNNKVQPGDLKFRDVNGDGVIDQFDQVPQGYSNVPEKTFGFSLALNYKAFDFSTLFQGVGNVSLYYLSRQRAAGFGGPIPEGAADYLNESWTQERYDAGLPINFPRFSVSGSPNSQGSSFFLADASYLRLKNAEIGYTVRASFLRRIGASSCRIYANANNLITWKKTYDGVDPENASSNTADTNLEPYPLVRTVNVGLNLNF